MFRKPSGQPRDAAHRARLFSHLAYTADDHIVDGSRIDAAALRYGRQGGAQEVGGMNLGQRTACFTASQGRANCVYHEWRDHMGSIRHSGVFVNYETEFHFLWSAPR